MISPVKMWRNQKRITSLVGKTGVIVSFTIIYVPPAGFSNQAPYPVVLVKLESGQMITCQMVDYQQNQIAIGQTVQTIVRKIMEPDESGIIPYGIKVKPL